MTDILTYVTYVNSFSPDKLVVPPSIPLYDNFPDGPDTIRLDIWHGYEADCTLDWRVQVHIPTSSHPRIRRS